MARLNSAIKLGYYPASPVAIDQIASRIIPCHGSTLLDPCAGEGDAVGYLATRLAVLPENTYAIELDGFRGGIAKTNPAIGNTLTPATIFGCAVPYQSMSMLWLNPPFDDEMGRSGRCEADFLRHATNWLCHGGVLALVCPEPVVTHWSMQPFLAQNYEQISIIPFPDEVQKYREVVVLAYRRKTRVELYDFQRAPEGFRYRLQPAKPVKWFRRDELPEEVLEQRIKQSKLQRILREGDETATLVPPLALGTGHIALLLASGQLDGVVRPEGEQPHVVRGTARKVQVQTSKEEGEKKTVTTYTEQIELAVRAVFPDGTIITYGGDE